jgi:hypothetical protein
MKLRLGFLFVLSALFVTSLSFSLKTHADEEETAAALAAAPAKHLEPATTYNGASPIELKNGMLFNNGTFGAQNPEYETWAQGPFVVPGISEKTYPFSAKEDFVAGLEESERFVDTAIWNWGRTTNMFPDALSYAKASTATMQPILDKYRTSLGKVRSAGQGDWDSTQAEARRSLVELRSTYAQLHKNVH